MQQKVVGSVGVAAPVGAAAAAWQLPASTSPASTFTCKAPIVPRMPVHEGAVGAKYGIPAGTAQLGGLGAGGP